MAAGGERERVCGSTPVQTVAIESNVQNRVGDVLSAAVLGPEV